MSFELGQAVLAGLIGTIAMTVVMYMGSMMGMKMDMPMTLGTMFLPKGATAWTVGLMLHLMMGIIFFLVYAGLIDAFGIRLGVAGWTALFGAIHAIAIGPAFGMMPMLHPRMATGPEAASDRVPAPGFMGLKMGMMGPMGIIAAHVVYGLVAGAVYAV
ncbi:MAG: hypothetical protein HYY00_03005 [Chloroflexi bacterium]|nr:hypothetical protein [Chloroflexota bacterium]